MEEFTVGFRRNREFDFIVAAYFAVEGLGVAAFIISAILAFPTGLFSGLFLMLTGMVVLMLDLGQPLRFWRAIRRAGKAWISRGSILVGSLILLGTLYSFSPSLRSSSLGKPLLGIIVLIGLAGILYTGFLLFSMSAVPLWHNRLVPPLFLCHSLTSGLMLVLFLLVLTGFQSEPERALLGAQILIGIITLLLTIIHIVVTSGTGLSGAKSVHILVNGSLKWQYLVGAIIVGLLLPMLVLTAVYLIRPDNISSLTIILGAILLFRVIGEISFRNAVLQAGIYELVF